MNQLYSQQVRSAAHFAIFTAVVLITLKSVAWWQTNSVSMLASITDSLLDLLSSLMNLLILRFSLMPPDDNHSFGHGKAESLASLVQGAFISGSAIFLLLQGVYRLNNPQPLINNFLGIAVTIFSILLTGILVFYQYKVIQITDSPAIKSDKLHYQTDLLMNVAILCAFILTNLGFLYVDAIFAILIGSYILYSALKMLFESTQLLLDQALPENEIQQIAQSILSDKRILGFHDLRTRRSGGLRFIQLHLELDDHLSFVEAHDITDSLEQRLSQLFPQVDIVIHHEPTCIVKAEGKSERNK